MEHDIVWSGWLFGSGELDAHADSRKFHFACEESEGSAPVGALLGGSTGDSVILWDVKPGGFTVNQEEIFFGGFVLPTHFTGAAKVGSACFGSNDSFVVGINLEEGGLKGVGCAVAGFEFGGD